MNDKDIRKMLKNVLKGYNITDKRGNIVIAHNLYRPYLHYYHYGSSAISLDHNIVDNFTWLINTIFKGFTLEDFNYQASPLMNENKKNKKGVL